mmetsp:Transcript_20130/g.26043  ORF Transcript_20130/g.26043 Transcript_20130/m.26043 type:complete len:165 (-) Transcript_20130:253-747(-)
MSQHHDTTHVDDNNHKEKEKKDKDDDDIIFKYSHIVRIPKPKVLTSKTNTSPKKSKPKSSTPNFNDHDQEDDFDDNSYASPKESKKTKLSIPIYANKPVEANFDDCAVCAIGGDLLCCDFCPEAFHLKCAGLHRIPDGLWSCPACIAKGIESKPPRPKKRARSS